MRTRISVQSNFQAAISPVRTRSLYLSANTLCPITTHLLQSKESPTRDMRLSTLLQVKLPTGAEILCTGIVKTGGVPCGSYRMLILNKLIKDIRLMFPDELFHIGAGKSPPVYIPAPIRKSMSLWIGVHVKLSQLYSRKMLPGRVAWSDEVLPPPDFSLQCSAPEHLLCEESSGYGPASLPVRTA